ncbi:hypothetical protein ABL78_3907 [Leptomonas seymouri]|uniref:Fanconi-associated nuclease n=1 Tax=Leptomonas seymouri TaxID=5684 RepID=A0A0N0P5Y1_LEPSE|nr:hypothetical protein ABL78_3907 [Leptomonas seymouri]|eukprot:KPI86996.1 hypothetical protein ABL78_3907 [Leptomonas seymouri]
MYSASNEDSVVEQPSASLAAPAHPADPFLNPRRITETAPTLPHQRCDVANTSEAVTTVSAPHALSETLRPSPKRGQPSASSTASSAAAAQAKVSPPRCPPAKALRVTASARRSSPGVIASGSARLYAVTPEGGDEEESLFADYVYRQRASDSILPDLGGSDDDREKGEEERALIAAASAAIPDAHGASGVATPHPWLVTDAFHVSLWYVLRYAGSALSATDLLACRALLSLTAVLPSPQPQTEENQAASVADNGMADLLPKGNTESTNSRPTQFGTWTWSGMEESELLLRLVLRKPHGFTRQHLEARYGDWLHVQPTLTALMERRLLWWGSRNTPARSVVAETANSKAQMRKSAVRVEGEAVSAPLFQHAALAARCTSVSDVLMLEQYDGTRVAQMVLQGGDVNLTRQTDDSAAAMPFATEELIRLLQAVRGTEMRLFLTALRYGSKAHVTRESRAGELSPLVSRQKPEYADDIGEENASVESLAVDGICADAHPSDDHRGSSGDLTYKSLPLGENCLYDVIPRRKQDMICYFVERRYSLWAPTSQTTVTCQLPDTSAKTSAAVAASRPSVVGGGAVRSTEREGRRREGTQWNEGNAAAQATKQFKTSDHNAAASVKRCFRDMKEEALLVAKCWDAHVGPVYVPHAGLKSHLVWMTEIFHVLTANGGAGAVGQQGLKPLAATMEVAAPPTLLMLRPQLLLLLESLQSARLLRCQADPFPADGVPEVHVKGPFLHAAPPTATERGTQKTAGTAFLSSVPYALLPQWFLAPANLQSPSAPSASSAEALTAKQGATSPTEWHNLDLSLTSLDADAAGEDVICSSRRFHAGDANGGDQSCSDVTRGMLPPVQLFGTPTMLLEYRAALHTQRALYEVTDGAVSAAQRFRGRNEAFVSAMYDTVMSAVRAGVAAIKRHPSKNCSSKLASEAVRFVSSFPLLPEASQPAPVSLDSILYKKGSHAEHLLAFTPLFRWFACLEGLYQLLQSARRYADANECLHYLLYEPIYVLHHVPELGGRSSALTAKGAVRTSRGLSPVTYAFRYKMHKRGEWLSRLAQNLTHLKRYPGALAILEEAQTGYHELAGEIAERANQAAPFADTTNETAAALCGVLTGATSDESMLPAEVQRRGRMLRVLWPSLAPNTSLTSNRIGSEDRTCKKAFSSFCPSPLALYHAVWEYVRDRYCRRHDRLALEQLLAMLHRRVRRWTPLATYRQLTARQLADVGVLRVSGVRDAVDYMLWREPRWSKYGAGGARTAGVQSVGAAGAAGQPSCSRTRSALPVEQFVLEHFLKEWNLPGKGEGLPSLSRKRLRNGDLQAPNNAVDAEGSNNNTYSNRSCGVWCGAHCEGQWIRCLAHALLWDCYWAYPSLPSQVADAPDSVRQASAPRDADHELLWLSAFQDGPLDVTTPVHFLLRRREVIETRIAYLERCSRQVLLRWVAAHIKSDSGKQEQQRNAPTLPREVANRPAHSPAKGSECSLSDAGDDEMTWEEEEAEPDSTRGLDIAKAAATFSGKGRVAVALERAGNPAMPKSSVSGTPVDAEEESRVLCTSTLTSPPVSPSVTSIPFDRMESERQGQNSKRETVAKSAEANFESNGRDPIRIPTIPEAWKVSVGSLPLLDILRVLPLPPLWRLLRCLYLSPVTEGVPLRFSGFPDLVFWRRNDAVDGERERTMRLSDKLNDFSEGAPHVVAANVSEDASPPFCLMEVKSPSDTLSTKQIAVNDILHRCGFHVFVLRVDAVDDNGEPLSTKIVR